MTITDHNSHTDQQPIWETLNADLLRPGGLTLTEHALTLCQLPPGACLLDLGCGSAATVSLAARLGYTCIGIDMSAVLLWRGHVEYGSLPLLRAVAACLPLTDCVIDAVLAECSLSAIQQRDCALEEIQRVLKPGGMLIISDIYARNPQGLTALRRMPIDACLSNAQSAQQITDLLRAHGFQIVHWEDHSETLKRIAACGGSAAFWTQTAGVDPFDLQLALARAKLGYYLLVAMKSGEVT